MQLSNKNKVDSFYHLLLSVLFASVASLFLSACSNDSGSTGSVTELEASPMWQNTLQVETSAGTVKAVAGEESTLVWKAIPYAQPPVADQRWQPPKPAKSWSGVREEAEFANICPQPDLFGGSAFLGDEDCLYLNVWRPNTEATDLPVYVWIHGGGNSIGGATQFSGYYGHGIANRSNVVFVSMNYRLGPLGWLTHPAMRHGDDALADSGNYATLDLILALQWIKDNIKAFGGDPDRVMITGESAGGMNVYSLLISPLAQDLFHSAMSQSGGDMSISMTQADDSANGAFEKMLVNDGSASSMDDAQSQLLMMTDEEIRDYLHSKEPVELYDAYEKLAFGMISIPTVFRDGTVVSGNGLQAYPDGQHLNQVPVILGSNKDETKLFLFADPGFNTPNGFDVDLYEAVAGISSDGFKIAAVDDGARKISTYPDHPGVYAYQFLWGAAGDKPSTLPIQWADKLGACHALEVPFFFGNENFNEFMGDFVFNEANRPGRLKLSEAMMTYAAAMAYHGDPNGDDPNGDGADSGLPQWQTWTPGEGKPKLILFDTDADDTDLKMSDLEMDKQSMLQDYQQSLGDELFNRTMDFVSGNALTSGLTDGL